MTLTEIGAQLKERHKEYEAIKKLKLHTPYIYKAGNLEIAYEGDVLFYLDEKSIEVHVDGYELHIKALAYESEDDSLYDGIDGVSDFTKIEEVKREDLPLYINWHTTVDFKKFLDRR